MAQWKFTAKRGAGIKDVTLSAGTPIAGGDAIEVNVDQSAMSKSEFLAGLDSIRARATVAPWPAA